MPWKPVSEAPTESTTIRFGKRCLNCSFTDGEKTAAVLATTNSDARSRPALDPASASTSGRPIASPVIASVCTRSFSMIRQTASGSKERSP